MSVEMIGQPNCRQLLVMHCNFISLIPKDKFWTWRINFLTIISGGSRIFPRGGREPSRGGVNTPNFPENCMKSKEFGRPGGGVRPSRPPLDPPMIISNYRKKTLHILANKPCYITHCRHVYEQNSIVNNVHVDDWTDETAIIASNAKLRFRC